MSPSSVHSSSTAADSRQPIDALVLDYGEVLCRPAEPAAMARLAAAAGLTGDAFNELYWRSREDYDRGLLDGPAYWARFGATIGRTWTAPEVEALIAHDTAAWTVYDERMVAWVEQRIASGLKVALLSNMVKEIGAHLKARFDVLSRFHHLTLSSEVKSVKPEPAIYRHVLDGLDVAPSRALLIDDRPINIEGALAVGMPGIVFRGYDALLQEIDERFVLTPVR